MGLGSGSWIEHRLTVSPKAELEDVIIACARDRCYRDISLELIERYTPFQRGVVWLAVVGADGEATARLGVEVILTYLTLPTLGSGWMFVESVFIAVEIRFGQHPLWNAAVGSVISTRFLTFRTAHEKD